MSDARLKSNQIYAIKNGERLTFDAYAPGSTKKTDRLPAIVFVGGASDTKDWQWFTDYGRLSAASGLVGITFNKRYPPGMDGIKSATEDVKDLLKYIREHAHALNIDATEICLWTFSAGGRLSAVALQRDQSYIRALVIFYGILDVDSEIASQPRSEMQSLTERYSVIQRLAAMGSAGPRILLVRAGKDSPAINDGIARFVAEAQLHNARLTFVNYPEGVHGFDAYTDEDAARSIIKQAFAFAAKK